MFVELSKCILSAGVIIISSRFGHTRIFCEYSSGDSGIQEANAILFCLPRRKITDICKLL